MRASLLGSQCSERGSLSGVKQRVEAWKGPGVSLGGAQLRVWPRLSGEWSSRWASATPRPPSHVPPVGVPAPPSLGPAGHSAGLGARPPGCPLLCRGASLPPAWTLLGLLVSAA